MEDNTLPTEQNPWRIEIDGKSLPFWFEEGKIIVKGYVDRNNQVVPTPRPDYYMVRIDCTAEIIVRVVQDGPPVDSQEQLIDLIQPVVTQESSTSEVAVTEGAVEETV